MFEVSIVLRYPISRPLSCPFKSPGDHFDFASAATKITTTLAGSVALLAIADRDTGDRPFATATTKGAGGSPLASAFGA